VSVLEDETVLLEALDLVPPCEWRQSSEHNAEVVMMCRGCRKSVLLCKEHVAKVRAVCDNALVVGCTQCGRESRSFDEAVEVVTL
jgi:hypothetical protein